MTDQQPLTCTPADVISWGPCNPPYTPERIYELAGDKEHWTVQDVLDLDIPPEDRLWVVLRPELIPERTLHLFACDCAEWALENERARGQEPDPRSWQAIEVKRRWLDGLADDDELVAARDAAWDAARDAAWAAAARAAAWAAAARAAAWKHHLKRLHELLAE